MIGSMFEQGWGYWLGAGLVFIGAVWKIWDTWASDAAQAREMAESMHFLWEMESQWHVRFAHGVHQYQEHDDGRRRAVRIVANGECPLLDEWLRDGRSVEV